MTLHFEQSRHTPVYSKDSAAEVGRVVRYLVDAGAARIAAVHIGGRRRRALLADWSHIVGFGPDAVVVDSEENLRHPDSEREQQVVAGNLDLFGRRVLTDSGHEIGELTDVSFDEDEGAVEALHTTRSVVAGDGLLAIGPYAVVVQRDAVAPRDDDEQA
jgi:uncharacterized protein YrrD